MKRIKTVRNSKGSSLFSISCFLQPVVGYGTLKNKNKYICLCLKLIILLGVLSVSTLTGWAGINEWTSNFPGGVIYSVAVSPNYANDSTVFAGANHGFYKSTDGGQSWIQSPFTYMYAVFSVAVSPNYATDATVFARFAESGPDSTGTGVYKSTNRGQSWTLILPDTEAHAIAFSPNYATDATVFAGTTGGIYRSTNGGGNWAQMNNGLPLYPSIFSIALSPNYATDATVFAGTYGGGVYKSTDRGQNWVEMNNGLPMNNVWTIAVSPNYATDTTVFAGVNYGIYKSIDGGQSWTEMNIGLLNPEVRSIAIYSDTTVFAGIAGRGVYISTNGGQNWTAINNGLTDTVVLSLAIPPSDAWGINIFAGTYSGVFDYTKPFEIMVTPTSHNFGNVQVGGSSVPQTFTITNIGTTDAIIGTITLTGTNASEFSKLNDNCSGQTMATGNSCMIEAVFSPTAIGIKSANLSIPSNVQAPNVPLSGTGKPEVECNLVPDATVIPRGGTLVFQATVTNHTGEVQVLYFATRVTKPYGRLFPRSRYLVGPIKVILNPYESKSKLFSQYVYPYTTPLGTYTYHGYVVTGDIYDECQFQFTVTQ